MQYYIQEWPDMTASLIAEDGYTLNTFDSTDEAIEVCISECMVKPSHIKKYFCYLDASPVDFESSFL